MIECIKDREDIFQDDAGSRMDFRVRYRLRLLGDDVRSRRNFRDSSRLGWLKMDMREYHWEESMERLDQEAKKTRN